MKLGEALVKAGLISQDQLKTALERQVVCGGRIDTNIVELRFLDDDRLTKFLGQFLKLPVITPESIDSIPHEIISTVKKEIAEEYGLLPFKKEGVRLHVAMLNPKNLRSIEDLRFVTGFDIIPYVITELRLLNALDKYYGIKKELRYISVVDRFNPDSDIEIERSESKFTRENTKTTTERILSDNIRGNSAIQREAGTAEELIGALLSNAFFAAKLFRAIERSPVTDDEVEDQVIRNWIHFREKVSILMSHQ
jgi:hypothetical protein